MKRASLFERLVEVERPWCRRCRRRNCKCTGAPPGVSRAQPPEADVPRISAKIDGEVVDLEEIYGDLVASSGLPLTPPG